MLRGVPLRQRRTIHADNSEIAKRARSYHLDSLESRQLFSVPSAPSDLHAIAISSTQVNITWMDNSDNEDGFVVEYSTTSDFTSNVHALAAGADTGSKWIMGLPAATNDTPWHIRVFARNGDGDSGPATAVSAVTRGTMAHNTIMVNGFTRADIITAINASDPGDTIFFQAGTYNISSRISNDDLDILHGVTLGDGRVYMGETSVVPSSSGAATVDDQTILHCTSAATESSDRVFFNLNKETECDDITFTNLTFEGAGIYADSEIIDRVVVKDCHFDVTTHTGNKNVGIEWKTTGFRDSAIINNVFYAPDSFGIFGDGLSDHLSISNNELTGEAGMHCDAASASVNLLVEQNHLGLPGSPIKNQAVELQGSGSNTVVQDNYYENDGFLDYTTSSFAFSIPLDGGSNNVSRRNYIEMEYWDDASDDIGVRYIFELGGDDLDNYDNYSFGGNTVEATDLNATGFIRDNQYIDFKQAIAFDGGLGTISNNGPSVQLTWDTARPKAGPHERVYGLAIGSGLLTVHGTKLTDTVAVEQETIGGDDFYVVTLNGEQFMYPADDLAAVQFVESKRLASLTIGDGATVVVEEHGTANSASGTLIFESLTIDSGGVLDLTNNSAVLDYSGSIGTLLDDVRSYLLNGQMLTSTSTGATTIGYLDNTGTYARSTFAGQSIDSTSIMLMYTYGGDITLDGYVNVADFTPNFANYNPSHTGSATAHWLQGDYNYDGWNDAVDYGIFALNWNAGPI
jgi:hypothetical protein